MLDELAGEDVKAFRDAHGLSRLDLADRIGGAVRTIEDWEAGRRQPPPLLRLVLAAIERKLEPWRLPTPIGPDSTPADIREAATRRFQLLGDDEVARHEDDYARALRDEATPAEMLILARMVHVSDGYQWTQLYDDWSQRPKSGWHTTFAFRPDFQAARPTIGFETRYDNVAKQLAVFIDIHRPGERLPEKVQAENALLARGIKVISFSALDVLADTERCTDTIEMVLGEIAEEVLFEAGQIEVAWKRPDRR